jgi:hypothetical protein
MSEGEDMSFAYESMHGDDRSPVDRPERPSDPLDTLENQVRTFVRSHPTACLIGSAVLGFAAARLMRLGDDR